MDPLGTPDLTFLDVDRLLPTLTHWLQVLRKLQIQYSNFPVILAFFNFLRGID